MAEDGRSAVSSVYTLLDRKLREFGQLVLARNEPTVRRLLVDSVVGSGSMLEKHPGDFDLYHVGEFNAETGRLSVNDPLLLANLLDILQEESNGD